MAPDSGGINSSHFWLSSSYSLRWAEAQRGRRDWELGAQCCEHSESELTGVSTAAEAKGTRWPREWKAECDRFLLYGDRFKEFHAEGTLLCHEAGKKYVFRVQWERKGGVEDPALPTCSFSCLENSSLRCPRLPLVLTEVCPSFT